MYGLSLNKIIKIIQGSLQGGQGNLEPVGAGIDTRKIIEGELFFAVKGEKTDGHHFLEQARAKGAMGAVVTHIPPDFTRDDFPLILVDDTVKALQQLASEMRRHFTGPVVAITGSTGKTSTKDIVASVLSLMGPVLKTGGNYNNELGLPLTLLSLRREHASMVLEMGMRGLGEIDFLARISSPSYGIITNVGHTHQELLGSQEKIAQAKAEILSHIPFGGGVVLNLNDRDLLQPWLINIRCRLNWFGLDSKADIWAENIAPDHLSSGSKFNIRTKEGDSGLITFPVPGRHNIMNALSAAAIGRLIGLPWEQIRSGLENTRLTPMRLEFQEVTGKDFMIINDAYNANPASMTGALEVLANVSKGKRSLAVLGDMYELGGYTREGHRMVGAKTKEMDIAYLITVGTLADEIAKGALERGMAPQKIRACQNNQEALSYLKEMLLPGDVVLIKGSRGVKMEEIVDGLSSGQRFEEE